MTRGSGPAAEGPNTADWLLAGSSSADVAVVAGGREYSYGRLRSAAAGLVSALTELGLPAGARVALLGPNTFFWVAGYLAVLKAGLVVVPVSDKATVQDVRDDLDLVDCRVVLVDRRVLPRFAAALDGRTVVLTDAAVTDGPELPWPAAAPVDPDADAALMFTSGTTSRPRAVRVTHRNLQANTDSIVSYLQLRPDDRALVVLPFFYCYGASLLHTHLRVGGRLVLLDSFAFPESALDLLERQECTVLAGVPSTFQLLLRASSFATRALPSLRLIQQAGGKLAPVLVEELLAAANDARLFVMYGQTEATARLAFVPPDRLADKPGSIGRAIPGVELQVLDESGRPVGPGEQGEIYARGDNVSPGYWGDPEGSADRFTPHGLRTGDLATVDEDGYLYVVDRREAFVKCWGHRVSGQAVEAAALRLDRLVSAAAIGVPDPQAGEAVVLFVVPRPGVPVAPEEVLAVCRTNLARHMVPSTVRVLDALPLNGNGKVDRARLRELAAAGDPS